MRQRVFAAGLALGACLAMAQVAGAAMVTYNDLNEQLLYSNDGTSDIFDEPFDLTNNSGQTWTDFHLRIERFIEPNGPSFIDIAAGGFDGMAYEGAGTYTLSSPGPNGGLGTVLDIIGLSIANASIYSFTLDVERFDDAVFGDLSYNIYGTPTVDGVVGNGAVPEPSTAMMLAIGLFGAAGYGWRRRREAA